jgi:hypothetical protein
VIDLRRLAMPAACLVLAKAAAGDLGVHCLDPLDSSGEDVARGHNVRTSHPDQLPTKELGRDPPAEEQLPVVHLRHLLPEPLGRALPLLLGRGRPVRHDEHLVQLILVTVLVLRPILTGHLGYAIHVDL